MRTIEMTLKPDGSKVWSYTEDGKQIIHRDGDLPAVEMPNGTAIYYWEGAKHREKGPCYINLGAKGTQIREEWMYIGQRHNPSGPAVIRGNGTKEWYFRGLPHNYNGPCIVTTYGRLSYAIHGIAMSEAAHSELMRESNPVSVSSKLYSKHFSNKIVTDHILSTFEALGLHKEKEMLLNYSMFLKS